uniref:Uncharacterized protein n=1 Tax=Arundo donax TaxID=35708 RepID=A0A0A9CIB7_ARUDO
MPIVPCVMQGHCHLVHVKKCLLWIADLEFLSY